MGKRLEAREEKRAILEYYRLQILPLLPLAKKAFGTRTRVTPAHRASAEYTRLLCEFRSLDGSLLDLSDVLEVNYSGMLKRVLMHDTFIDENKPDLFAPNADLPNAASRIKEARSSGGTEMYHAQILEEYRAGFSIQNLAKALGVTSASILYYGAQRAMQREKQKEIEIETSE